MVKSTLPYVSEAGLTVVDVEIGRIELCSDTFRPDILMKRT